MSDNFKKEYVTPPYAGATKEKFGNFLQSVRDHLREDYRKQYVIRKTLCSFLVFLFWIMFWVPPLGIFGFILAVVLTW